MTQAASNADTSKATSRPCDLCGYTADMLVRLVAMEAERDALKAERDAARSMMAQMDKDHAHTIDKLRATEEELDALREALGKGGAA